MADIAVSKEAQLALVKLLVKLGLIPEEQTSRSYQTSDCCPISFFSRQGLCDEAKTIEKIAKKLQIPSFQFNKSNWDKYLLQFEHQRIATVSLDRWRDIRAVPVEVDEKRLVIAMANPLDMTSQEALKFDFGGEVRAGIAREEEILGLLAKKLNASHVYDLESILDKSGSLPTQTETEDPGRMESNVSSGDISAPPVVRLVNKILSDAVQAGASDIHVNPDKEGLIVRIRVDGLMQQLFIVPQSLKNEIISRLKLLSGMDISERRKPQDGRLRIKTGFGIKDLRLSTVPTVYGENLVIRILSSDISRLSFENLGADKSQVQIFHRILQGSSRVILVTGPTGSGKSSTLYACLLHLRDGTSNIITIEDPIEYRISGVNQIQVNQKIGVTFAEGLRSILRQDPDVIMVGEIRDFDTGSIAMQAAQTGHLVLSTLHTNTAAAAVTRMRDLGIPSYILASSLGSIIAQRLVRKLCRACSAPLKGIDLEQYTVLGIDPDRMRAPVGCDECGQSGFKGRTGIYSILEVSDAVRDAIRNEKSEQEIEMLARGCGFLSLTEAAINMLNEGITSIDEVERGFGTLDASAPEIHSSSTPHSGIQKRKLLLVEDDENTRAVLSLLLAREMYEVTEACDGLDALERIYEQPPEIIVCDLMMPRMNGLELLKKIRHDPRTKSIPILMLTAADSEGNECSSIELGADDFVSKTADSKIMLARIQRLLERQ